MNILIYHNHSSRIRRKNVSLQGSEVDSVTVPGEGLKGLVVGLATEVVDRQTRPLTRCHSREAIGADEPLQIVCGAQISQQAKR